LAITIVDFPIGRQRAEYKTFARRAARQRRHAGDNKRRFAR
jgi:hypothetical protein